VVAPVDGVPERGGHLDVWVTCHVTFGQILLKVFRFSAQKVGANILLADFIEPLRLGYIVSTFLQYEFPAF
jgi:hypothetical protein